MKTLSGQQPWWWAILHAGKRIENRVMVVRGQRRPPTWHRYRGPILLHASANCPDFWGAWRWMEHAGVVSSTYQMAINDLPRGGIVGRARIVDMVARGDHEHCSRLVGNGIDMRWWMPEQYGFVLTDVEPLPFYPCKGMLGLWEFDESLLKGPPPPSPDSERWLKEPLTPEEQAAVDEADRG